MRAGLDWRYLFFQQIGLYVVVISYYVKNCPLILCMFYTLYAVVSHLIRSKVVVLRLRFRFFFPASVEIRDGQDYLPSNCVFAVVSWTCFASLAIVVGMLWSEYRTKSAIPDLGILNDLVYVLQFMSRLP